MLFNNKIFLLYGIMAVAAASPVPQPVTVDELGNIVGEVAMTAPLDTRDVQANGKKITSFKCEAVILAEVDVRGAVNEMRIRDDKTVGSYPHFFGNKDGQNGVFGSPKKLREFPILQGSVYSGGAPGKYRAVTDYDDFFVGVMWEGAGAKMTKCDPVPANDPKKDANPKDKDHKDAKPNNTSHAGGPVTGKGPKKTVNNNAGKHRGAPPPPKGGKPKDGKSKGH